MAQQGQFGQQAGLAANISTLAQTYQIGTPVTEYKNNTVAKTVLGITLSTLGGLFLLIALVVLFAAGSSIFTKLLLILIRVCSATASPGFGPHGAIAAHRFIFGAKV